MMQRLSVTVVVVALALLTLSSAAFAQDTTVYGNGDVGGGQLTDTEVLGETLDRGGVTTGASTEVLGTRLLAETGRDVVQIALVGLGALSLGALMLVAGRRGARRDATA